MSLSEDLALTIKNPEVTLRALLDARQRIKFYTHLHEIYFKQPYYWLWSKIVEGTTIIDIGAFIGDTAIYFALNRNVRKIIAYEPHPKTFEVLKDNIDQCPIGFRKKMVLKNMAILEKEGYVNNSNKDITGTNKVKLSTSGIRATTLYKELAGLKKVAIKADCEGAELHMFDNADLSNVYLIQMETHGTYDHLEKILKSKGFKVSGDAGRLGYLYAERA